MYRRTSRGSWQGGRKNVRDGMSGNKVDCAVTVKREGVEYRAVKLEGEFRFGWSEFEPSPFASKEEGMGSK